MHVVIETLGQIRACMLYDENRYRGMIYNIRGLEPTGESDIFFELRKYRVRMKDGSSPYILWLKPGEIKERWL